MHLLKQNIERDGSGTVTLFPEEPEDMVQFLLAFNQAFSNSSPPASSGSSTT